MLLNIVPGFRELRAPLAAGYVWLLVAWLALGDSVSIPDEAQDFLDQFSAIGDAAALSFAAYIVGGFITDGLRPLWNSIRKLRTRRWREKRWARKALGSLERDREELRRRPRGWRKSRPAASRTADRASFETRG